MTTNKTKIVVLHHTPKKHLDVEQGQALNEHLYLEYFKILSNEVYRFFRITPNGLYYYGNLECEKIITFLDNRNLAGITVYVPEIKELKQRVSPSIFEKLESICILKNLDEALCEAQKYINEAEFSSFERLFFDEA